MIKTIITTTILILLVGCASNRSGSTEASSLADQPEWFTELPSEDGWYYATGYAKKQNPGLRRKTAVGRARDEVANSVEVTVNTMLKDFMQESGIGDRAEALEFTKSVSEQVASQVLQGSIIVKQQPGKDNTYYALVKYSVAQAAEATLQAVKREEALFNEFKAEQGFDDLENAIRNNLK